MEKNQVGLLMAALQNVLMKDGVIAKDVGAVGGPQLLLAAEEYVKEPTADEIVRRFFGSKEKKSGRRMIEIEFDRLEALEDIARFAHEKSVRMVYEKNNMKTVDILRSHAQIDDDMAEAVSEWWKTIPK